MDLFSLQHKNLLILNFWWNQIYCHNPNSTQPNITKVGVDMKMTLHMHICLAICHFVSITKVRCLQNEKVQNIFPINTSTYGMKTRKKNKYAVNQIRTERYKKSAIPYMLELLNNDESQRIETIGCL